MDEQALISRIVKHKDKEAFELLYHKYANYALRVASMITKDHALAADAVQEAFIRVYINIESFSTGKPFKPWFYRILINECNRLLKKGSKVSYISDYIENEKDHAKEDRKDFEEYEDLYKAVEELEDIHKIPIVLKYLTGFKEVEIAQILDINVNTLKSRLYKGREKLRKFLINKSERRNNSDGR